MPKCEHCQADVEFPFKCNYCGKYFCEAHRLPENHNCTNQPARTPLGSWQTKKEIAYVNTEKQTCKLASEGDYHFIREISKSEKLETKKPFPIKKVIGLSLVVIMVGALLWYSPTILSLFSYPQPNHKIETFQFSASYILTPANVSRSIQLRNGQTLKGNFTITGLPSPPDSFYYFLGVSILDSQKNILALYTEPAKSFSITATTSGIYTIIFTCTTSYSDRLPLVLSVTLAYDIIS